MKYCCFFVFALLLSACGEGGGYSDGKIPSDHTEILQLNGHSVQDIFKLENESLWIIVGLSGSLTEEEMDVIIYDNPNDFGEPDQGVRGKYYVFINNSADSFYIDPVPSPPILKAGNAELATLSVGTIAVLDDDSIWRITGVDSAESSGNSFDYTLYSVNEEFLELMPQTTADLGNVSDWYLYNEDAPIGYYLEPLIEAEIIWEGVHTFYSEGLNDSVLLSDGSLWLITGSLYPESSATGEYAIKLINNVALLEDPSLGDRAETILYIQGQGIAFYVKKI